MCIELMTNCFHCTQSTVMFAMQWDWRLKDDAGQHEATWDAHQPLRPPVHHLVSIVAALDGTQHAVVVKEVDVDVGSQAHKHLDIVATWFREREPAEKGYSEAVGRRVHQLLANVNS